MDAQLPQRIVPGAPPPALASKSAKKKRKAGKPKGEFDSPALTPVSIPDAASAALIDHAPQPSDIREGSVAESLLVQPPETATANGSGNGLSSAVEDPNRKTSPIVEIVSKKLKATTKKITRMQSYASTDPAKLNDDQRRTLRTLPSLEAVAKELEEVKKAIEHYEAEQATEQAFKQLAAERAEAERLAAAIIEAREAHAARTAALLNFIRLQSLLATRHPAATAIAFEEPEVPAIFSAVDTLLGEENEHRQNLIGGLLSGEGEYQGILHSRFLDLANAALNQPEPEEVPVEEIAAVLAAEAAAESVPDVLPAAPGGFHFMQESELENPLGTSHEWVDVAPEREPEPDVHVEKTTEVFVSEDPAAPIEIVERTTVVSSEPECGGRSLRRTSTGQQMTRASCRRSRVCMPRSGHRSRRRPCRMHMRTDMAPDKVPIPLPRTPLLMLTTMGLPKLVADADADGKGAVGAAASVAASAVRLEGVSAAGSGGSGETGSAVAIGSVVGSVGQGAVETGEAMASIAGGAEAGGVDVVALKIAAARLSRHNAQSPTCGWRLAKPATSNESKSAKLLAVAFRRVAASDVHVQVRISFGYDWQALVPLLPIAAHLRLAAVDQAEGKLRAAVPSPSLREAATMTRAGRPGRTRQHCFIRLFTKIERARTVAPAYTPAGTSRRTSHIAHTTRLPLALELELEDGIWNLASTPSSFDHIQRQQHDSGGQAHAYGRYPHLYLHRYRIMTSSASEQQQQPRASSSTSTSTPAAVIAVAPAPSASAWASVFSPQVTTYFIAGGVAGAASRTVVSPLERLKIIQQVQPTGKGAADRQYKGVWRSLVRMWREEGFQGYMRGNGINCVRIIPYSAVQFTTYEQLKKWFTRGGTKELDTPTRLLSGALAGITSVCTTYPLDLVRSRLSIATSSILNPPPLATPPPRGSPAFASAYHTSAIAVFREEGGVRALYRGLVTTSMGVAPYVGINFAAYEALRGVLTPPGKTSVTRKLACGALAGSISQTLTYPFDVVRRKMQVVGMKSSHLGPKYSGAVDAVRVIVRNEGLRGMYRGLWPNLLKVAPSIAMSFFTYELVKEFLLGVP
ncbi:hypothetical protein EVG20_g5196 [Dentipellis fragilis]|uniref:Uncharacterized protein n=1 Tax=Dentipellis fragilis TaxID=205917 RepID=A0A4Y9YUM1_9AGAM|nr:hypothetical protein EVG20_g5196 [Dentipellis fragilis]